MKNFNKLIWLVVSFIMIYGIIISQSITNTKHNLSSAYSNTVKASTEDEICIFCHTPHSASSRTPLWNRNDPGSTYQLYSSTTMTATTGNPDGESLMCLSCHDGTIALGSVVSRSSAISFGSVTTMPTGRTNLGTDLRDDHPISFSYSSSTTDAQIKGVSSITAPVHLDGNGKVQCTSCHDPHTNPYNKFLITTNQSSSLCNACHQKTNWGTSTHSTSTRGWNNSGTNPWPHTSYTTVATNACENCHDPHSAQGSKRLLNYSSEENNCLYCHNGNVAQTNINGELSKTYKHDVGAYTGTHDAAESNIPSTRHVECVDCHNPHQSYSSTASAPNVKGYNRGVNGVNSSGNNVSSVSYQYEICFKCHSTSNWVTNYTTRTLATSNTRLSFQTSNVSFHSVIGQNSNSTLDVPSLLTGWSTTSIMYCTDCHASNGTGSPKGPHGSTNARLLKLNMGTSDNTAYSPGATGTAALCWSCHRESGTNGIVVEGSTQPFQFHYLHIVSTAGRTSCLTCHDAHGVNGGTSTNNSHLISFNTAVVSADGQGNRRYVRTGSRQGYCQLRCHNETHTSTSHNYPR